MSSYHVELKSGHKGAAAEHACYIAREAWHESRGDLLFSGYGNLPSWTEGDPKMFWKAADRHERANGAAYRELVIALPTELSLEQLRPMVARLIADLVGARTYQYAVHASASSLQCEYNPHLHLMYSDRMPDGIARAPTQWFSRYNPANPALGGCKKLSGGKTSAEVSEELIATRKAVADIQNEFLATHGHEDRVDHRTLREQGVARRAERHLGPGRIRRMSVDEKEEYVALREEAADEE